MATGPAADAELDCIHPIEVDGKLMIFAVYTDGTVWQRSHDEQTWESVALPVPEVAPPPE